MITSVSDIKIKKKEILEIFKQNGYMFATDKSNKRYIVWNIKDLMMDSTNKQIIGSDKMSISELRSKYNQNPNTVIDNVTCEQMNIAINNLEKTLGYTISRLIDQSLFDYIPCTKQNLFKKSGPITLYNPIVMSVDKKDIYANIALTLQPMYLSSNTNYKETKFLNNFMVLCISTNVTSSNFICNTNIIDETNNVSNVMMNPTSQQPSAPAPIKTVSKYVDPATYKVGYVYADKNGSEYLYVGSVESRCTRPNYPPVITFDKDHPPMFLRLTQSIRRKMPKYQDLQSFMYDIFLQRTGYQYAVTQMLSTNRKRRFAKELKAYYANNQLTDTIVKMSIGNIPCDFDVKFHKPN